MNLRPYQERAVSELRLAFRNGSRAPLLAMPTGAGKTQVFSHITASAADLGRSVLILVHRRELVRQASAKLTAAGVTHGVIAAGTKPTDAPVQLASVQTLTRRMAHLTWSPDLIIIDEAHHAVAGSWARVLNHWPTAYRLGVTATPCRLDGRGLSDVFDQLVLGPSVLELVTNGYLSPHRFYAPPVKADLSGLRTRAGDFTPEDVAERMTRPTVTGDAIEHYRRIADGLPAIAFCCTVKHATAVCHSFAAAGYRSALVTGDMPAAERDANIAGLASGAVQVLVSVDVISEGTDVPNVAAAILLRPTQSESLYLQQVGRILRPQPGKTAVVLDHVGNVHRHGFPDDHRHWSLDAAPRKQRGSSTPAPSVRMCPECFAAFKPAPICPVCGADCQPKPTRQLQQVDGELRELKRTAKVIEFEERHARRTEVGRARTLDALLAVAKNRGYSAGWAYRIHNARNRTA